jgi:hypothetical protein
MVFIRWLRATQAGQSVGSSQQKITIHDLQPETARIFLSVLKFDIFVNAPTFNLSAWRSVIFFNLGLYQMAIHLISKTISNMLYYLFNVRKRIRF